MSNLSIYLTKSMEQNSCWEAIRPSARQEIPRILWNPKFRTAFTTACSLSLSWTRLIQSMPSPPTSWAPILILCPLLRLAFPNGPFPSDLPHQTPVCNWSFHPMRATWASLLSVLDLITPIIFEENRSRRLSFCSLLHVPLTSSLLGPYIFLSTLFSIALSLFSFLNVEEQVEWKYSSTYSQSQHQTRVSGQIHTPTALPSGTEPPAFFEYEVWCAPDPAWILSWRENLSTAGNWTGRLMGPAPYPVTLLTEIDQLGLTFSTAYKLWRSLPCSCPRPSATLCQFRTFFSAQTQTICLYFWQWNSPSIYRINLHFVSHNYIFGTAIMSSGKAVPLSFSVSDVHSQTTREPVNIQGYSKWLSVS